MPKGMSPRNRPKSNTCNGLTKNGGGAAAGPAGSAPEANARRPPRSSRLSLRRFFAPGTPAAAEAGAGGFESLAGDVDELAAILVRPNRNAGVGATAAATAAGLQTEASSRSGTGAAVSGVDVEPGVLPPAGSGVHVVGRRVEVLAAGDRSSGRTRTFAPALGGLVVAGG